MKYKEDSDVVQDRIRRTCYPMRRLTKATPCAHTESHNTPADGFDLTPFFFFFFFSLHSAKIIIISVLIYAHAGKDVQTAKSKTCDEING